MKVRSMKKIVSVLLCVYVTMCVIDQPVVCSDEDSGSTKRVIVTATKTNIEEEKIAKSVTVVTEEDIEDSKVNTVAEALRNVPGVTLRNAGGIGRLTTTSIRGGASAQTLMLFDGVQSINSPTVGTANIADLFTTGIERIEVLRGGSGVLYGSAAQAGVVNVITKRGKGTPEFEGVAEFGSYRTFRETVGLSGSLLRDEMPLPVDELYFASSVTRVDSDGDGVQNDYENWYFTNRFGVDLNEYVNLDFVNRIWESETGLDNYTFSMDPVGETDHFSKNEMITLKPTININYGWWEAKYSYAATMQNYYAERIGGYKSKADINVHKMDLLNNIYFPKIGIFQDTLTFGFDLVGEGAEFTEFVGSPGRDKSTTQWGCYFQNEVDLFDRLILNGGVRFFRHNNFKRDSVWSASAAYLHHETGTKLKASYDQSFRSPTLNDLYWPSSTFSFWGTTYVTQGNSALKPEEGEHYDIGFEQKLLNNALMFGASFFTGSYSGLISWMSSVSGSTITYQPTNINSATVHGIETEAKYTPHEDVTIRANYTYIDSKDKQSTRSGEDIYGVPRHSANIGINWKLMDTLNFNADCTFVSRKKFSGAPYKVNDYCKVDCSITYDITKNYQVFGRIDNLLNAHYMETAGYPQPGTTFFIGGKVRFGGDA